MDSGGISEKSFRSSFSVPSASAILPSDRRDMSPEVSKRFTEPRLTPESSESLCWLMRRRRRKARTFAAMERSISLGDGGSRDMLFIDSILSKNALFCVFWIIYYP